MKNGWTGGQYTIFRALFGAYLFVHFAQLAPWAAEVFSNAGILPEASASPILHFFPNLFALWDTPAFVIWAVSIGAGLSLCFAFGILDRWAAVAVWYLWASLLGRNPLIANPSIPYVGWLLLAHACLPRPRSAPDQSPWRLPPSIFAAAWLLMALGYSYSGFMKLLSPSWQDGTAILGMVANPLGRSGPVHAALMSLPTIVFKLAAWGALSMELFFAPLCLMKKVRPWMWSLLLVMHLSLIVLIDFADLSLGMVMLHLFTFDPAWIAPRGRGAPGLIFYDGDCGLCHRFVRFVLSEEPAGEGFHFSPLASGDSIVVRTGDDRTLLRSDAVIYVLGRLGGFWRLLGAALRLVPRPLRDAVYSLVASMRRRLFAKPDGACPVLSPALRPRFQNL